MPKLCLTRAECKKKIWEKDNCHVRAGVHWIRLPPSRLSAFQTDLRHVLIANIAERELSFSKRGTQDYCTELMQNAKGWFYKSVLLLKYASALAILDSCLHLPI